MFPRLAGKCCLKGVAGGYFLLDLIDFLEFTINDVQALVLSHCNGSNTEEVVSKKTGLELTQLREFFADMERLGLLIMEDHLDLNLHQPNLEVKGPYLREVHLDITSRCNLKCRHCYQEPYLQPCVKEMTTDQIKELIRQMEALNVCRLVISGGEPFLRKDLVDLIYYALLHDIVVPTVFTNGTVLNEHLERILRIDKPMTLAISLDGDTAESNDFIRGSGSFDKTITFLQRIAQARKGGAKTKVVIDTMMHQRNFRHLQNMYQFLMDLDVDRWRVALPRDQGSFSANQGLIAAPVPSVLDEYEGFISWYIQSGRVMSNMAVQIESFFRSNMLEGRELTVFSPEAKCCAYKTQAMAIKPNGDVAACTAFTNLSVGNVSEASIADIWRSDQMQSIKDIKISSVQECVDCPYLYLCGTGCRRMALAADGFLTAKDSSMCPIYKFFHTRIIPMMEGMGVKLNMSEG